MSCYLSIDTEATGLTEADQLIQLGMVPVDLTSNQVLNQYAWETLVKCPSFEELKPRLNKWVIEHNEGLIKDAHTQGISPADLKTKLTTYLAQPALKKLFKGEKVVLLGKSLSALDIPLLTRTFGWDYMNETFHYHTIDVTCVAHFLVDAGHLPAGCQSTSKIIAHFGIRDNAKHTALSDASDMAQIYLMMLERMKKIASPL
jgi:DNA polymerase-3 subunit epsilon